MINPIEILHLSKTFPRLNSKYQPFTLKDVSFSVEKNEILGIIGLNGAGKSTLIKLLLDLIRPTKGSIKLLGYPNSSILWRSNVGYLPESFNAPKDSSVMDILNYLGGLDDLNDYNLFDKISYLLNTFDLFKVRDKKFKELSKGMKLRLGFAQALLNEPSLLILDEPMDGLDPSGRLLIRELLVQLRAQGTSVLLSSHIFSEIELVADRVIILDNGTIIKEEKIKDILPTILEYLIETKTILHLYKKRDCIPYGLNWAYKVRGLDELQHIIFQLHQANIEIVNIKSIIPSLEDYFFNSIDGK